MTYAEELAMAQAKAREQYAGFTGNIQKRNTYGSAIWYAECQIRDGRKSRYIWRNIGKMTKAEE